MSGVLLREMVTLFDGDGNATAPVPVRLNIYEYTYSFRMPRHMVCVDLLSYYSHLAIDCAASPVSKPCTRDQPARGAQAGGCGEPKRVVALRGQTQQLRIGPSSEEAAPPPSSWRMRLLCRAGAAAA